jgi:maleate cis-trans isomerase
MVFGWRGRIGYVAPVALFSSQERDQALPEGVVMVYYTLDIGQVADSEFERLFELYLPAAQHVADQDVQFMILSGSPVMEHRFAKTLDLAKRIEDIIGIPTIPNTVAHINGLKAVGATKVIIVSPFRRELDERRAKIFESEGLEVVHIEDLGLTKNLEWSRLAPYESYRLAVRAAREAPEADAINIPCPSWPVMRNIALIERDTGLPVVSSFASELYTALTAMRIRGPIEGFGQLLGKL